MKKRFLAILMTIAAAPWLTSGLAFADTPIHAGDRLSVTVYNHPELSTQATVTSRGDLPVPVAGDVHVAGLSEVGAAQRIQIAMTPYLRRPAVDVRIVQEGQSLFFSGIAVGVLPYVPGETLATAIGSFAHPSMSKVATPDATAVGAPDLSSVDFKHIDLERDGHLFAEVDLEELARSGQAGPVLEPGDVIALRSKPVRVDLRGDLRAPTTVYLDEGGTLTQAVDQAGGFGTSTSLANITLVRDGEERAVSAAGETMTAPAHDGDLLILRPAPHVTVIGTVGKPGDELLAVRPTLLGALYAAGGPNRDADLRHVKVVQDGKTRFVDLYGMSRGDLSADIPLHDGALVFVPQGRRIDPSAFLGIIGVLGTFKSLFGL